MNTFVKQTVGKVNFYEEEKGYGWLSIAFENQRKCFVSHRELQAKMFRLNRGDYVKYDLCENDKGYIAEKVYVISKEEFIAGLNNIKTSKSSHQGENYENVQSYR